MCPFDLLVENILNRKPVQGTWSLAQIGQSAETYHALCGWAADLESREYDRLAYQRTGHLGLILLCLHTEVVRRHGGEGELWPVLTDSNLVPWKQATWRRLYSASGYLLPSHSNALGKAVQMFNLRHAFDEVEVKRWYQLVYLQLGFTHEDAKKKLSTWLSGQRPVSVEKLLQAQDAGAREFQKMWTRLRQFRLGNVSLRNVEGLLKSCCWVLPEWSSDLIQAARESKIEWGEAEEQEDEAFFTVPRLVWTERGPPLFQTELCGLESLICDQDLELRCGGVVLRRLLRQADGGFAIDGDPTVTLGPANGLKSRLDLRLVAVNGALVRQGMATLWDGDSDVSLLRPSDGLLVSEHELKAGQSFFAITLQDIALEPPAQQRVAIGAGYVLHRYEAGWSRVIQGMLDDMAVWTSTAFGAPPSALPTDAVEVRWRGVLDFTDMQATTPPSPWWVGIETRMCDRQWAFSGMRWVRADGQLVSFKWVPEQLSLVEGDVARPITVRVVLRHSSGRVATVPATLPPPLLGCLRWPENGRPQVQTGQRTLLAADARRMLWSFFLPRARDESGMPQERDPRTCSFMEGDADRGHLRTRAGILPAVAGYGAPAWISCDPYNSDERLLRVASRIIDGGVIGKVRAEGGKMVVSRFGSFELGPEHRLISCSYSKDRPGQLCLIEQQAIITTDAGWEFPLPQDSRVLGLALFYRDARLGSWFDPVSWSRQMLDSQTASQAEMAAMLRTWKAPLLQEEGTTNHRAEVVSWLRREWREVLPVWLATTGCLSGPLGEKWSCQPMADHWRETVQSLLTEAKPRPDSESCWVVIEEMARGSGYSEAQDKLGFAVVGMAEVCPLLAARILRAALKTPRLSADKAKGTRLLNQLRMSFHATDQLADDLAQKHGRRDGVWLRACIPSLHELDQTNRILPLTYRRLAMNPGFRGFAFGVWLQEIRN